jgi:DNA helicase-2/ATP-dependent DNA helicase PcrA
MKPQRPSINEAQQKAATTTEGPLLVIAGPGSGKTHTLVERIVHLVTEHNVDPTEILVSTFTEKAAAELVTRVSNRLGELGVPLNVHEMYLGTLHSICLRLLDEHREHTRLKRSYAVLDQFDQQ